MAVHITDVNDEMLENLLSGDGLDTDWLEDSTDRMELAKGRRDWTETFRSLVIVS